MLRNHVWLHLSCYLYASPRYFPVGHFRKMIKSLLPGPSGRIFHRKESSRRSRVFFLRRKPGNILAGRRSVTHEIIQQARHLRKNSGRFFCSKLRLIYNAHLRQQWTESETESTRGRQTAQENQLNFILFIDKKVEVLEKFHSRCVDGWWKQKDGIIYDAGSALCRAPDASGRAKLKAVTKSHASTDNAWREAGKRVAGCNDVESLTYPSEYLYCENMCSGGSISDGGPVQSSKNRRNAGSW